MPGAFDDLVPEAQRGRSGGRFDDLVPSEPKRGLGETVGGLALDLLTGAMRAPKVVPDLGRMARAATREALPEPVRRAASALPLIGTVLGDNPVLDEALEMGSGFFQRGIDAATAVMPAGYAARRNAGIIERDAEGNFAGLTAPTPEALAGTIVQTLPQIPQMLLGGGLAAGGLRAAGASPAIASALGFGASNAVNVAPAQFADTLGEAQAAGMAPQEAEQAALVAGGLTGLLSTGTGAAGAALAQPLGGASSNLVSAILKGFAADAPFEGIEEGGQALIGDFAMGRPLDALGAADAAALGVLAGGTPGAALAGSSYLAQALDAAHAQRQPQAQPTAPTDAVATNAIAPELLRAGNAALRTTPPVSPSDPELDALLLSNVLPEQAATDAPVPATPAVTRQSAPGAAPVAAAPDARPEAAAPAPAPAARQPGQSQPATSGSARQWRPTQQRDARGRPLIEPVLDFNRDTLIEWLGANGGVDFEQLRAQGGADPAALKDPAVMRPFGRVGWAALRRKGGMSLDDLREKMQQDGWLPPDDPNAPPQIGNNEALDMVLEAINGRRVLHPQLGDQRFASQLDGMRQDEEQRDSELAADLGFPDAATLYDAIDQADERGEGFSTTDYDEALSLRDLYERLVDSGFGLSDAEIESIIASAGDKPADQAAALWRAIEDREGRHGADAAANRRGAQGRESPGREPQGNEFGRLEEARDGYDAQQPGLFQPPTQREEVDAERRRRDAARDGRSGTGRTDMTAGDGELFAGDRPSQTTIEEPRDDAYVRRGPVDYLADQTDQPIDFATEAEARRVADWIGGRIRKDDPIDGEPQTWSVIREDGPVTFAQQVRQRLESGDARGPMLDMGRTPAVLRMLGFRDLPLRMPGGVLFKLATGKGGERAPLTERQIARLPELLDEPVAVFESATVPGAMVVLTTQQDASGNPVIVSIAPEGREGSTTGQQAELRVNVLTSAYGKDGAQGWADAQVEAGRLRFLNDEAPVSKVPSRVQFPAGTLDKGPSGRTVRSAADLRNFRAEQRRSRLDVESQRDMFVTTRGDRAAPGRADGAQDEARNGRGDPDPRSAGAGGDDAGAVRPRADATPAVTRRGERALGAFVRRFGGSVLGDTIADDFRRTDTAQLIGQTARSSHDLAALAAVYRDPEFETMRYVFVDDDGRVRQETAVTSRMAATSTIFPFKGEIAGLAWVEKTAKDAGATGVWFIHNHPSGIPTPSTADIRMTKSMVSMLQGRLKVHGHVVLNHDTYAHITPTGEVNDALPVPGVSGADPLVSADPGPLDGARVLDPGEMARRAAQLYNLAPADSVGVLTVDSKGRITVAATIPAATATTPRGAAVVQRIAHRSRASFVVLVAEEGIVARNLAKLPAIKRAGLAMDIIAVKPNGEARSLLNSGDYIGAYVSERQTGRRAAMLDVGLRVYEYSPEQSEFMRKAGLPTGTRTPLQRVGDHLRAEWDKVRAAVGDSDARKQALFDNLHGLRAAEARLGLTDPETSPYVAARMTRGLAGMMEGVLSFGAPKWDGNTLAYDTGTKGLLDALKPVEGKLDRWLGWMVARRAELLKSQGRENLMSDADIQAGLSLAGNDLQAFQQAARDYLKIKNAVLDLAEQAGLVDPQARAAWDHAEYIPFYREENEQAIGPGTRRGLAGQSSGIRTLKGGDAVLADPLANIIRNFTRLVDASVKNNAVRLAVDQLGNTVFTKAPPKMAPALIPLDQVKRHLRQQGVSDTVLDAMPAGALKGMQRMLSIESPSGDNVVRLMRDGRAEFYEVADPLVLRALTAFREPQKNLAIKPLIWFKRLLTQGITTTADFVAANFLRDTGSAWVISDDRFSPGWDSIKGVVNTLRNDQGTREIMMAGGTFMGGHFYGGDPDAAAAALRRALRRKGIKARDIEGFVGTVARSPLHLWDAWMRISGAVENANRRAVYDAALKAGRSKTEAAFMARDLMDFSMQGDAAFIQFFSDVLPFFNARLQGLYKLGRRASTRDGKRAIALRGGVMVLASMALYAWNVAMYGDAFDDLEEWDKDAYWHIAPGTEWHVRIPKPFEIGIAFGTIPERIAEAIRYGNTGREGDTPTETWQALARAITGTLAINPIPQALLPIVEQWGNKRFFTGRPIESMGDDKLLPEAREEWFTSDTMKAVADVLPQSGPVALSAKRLQHLWEGYTGGMGAYVLDAADWVTRQVQDAPERPDAALRDFPLVGRFARGGSPATSKSVGEFYDRLSRAEKVEGTIKEYFVRDAEDRAGSGDLTDRALELQNKHADLLGNIYYSKRLKGGFGYRNVQAMRKLRTRLSNLRQDAEDVALSTKLSGAEKRQQLDDITRERNRLTREFLSKLRDQGPQPEQDAKAGDAEDE